MMKRVVCDETFPHPATHFYSNPQLASADRASTTPTKHLLFETKISREDCQNRRAKCFATPMVRFLLPPLSHSTHLHTTASMMKDYLDVNFYSIFSEAQNHADKFLVAFLLIQLNHTSHSNILQCLRKQ
jgi:hypothetical protein